MKSPKLIFAILIVSFFGFIDASYLSASSYFNLALPCYIVQGCEVVTTSIYSRILGVPVAYWGVIFYLSIFFGALLYVDNGKRWVLRTLHLLTSVGFLMTLWFLYVQLFLLKELCMYCLLSAFTSTLLFILCAIVFYKKWTPAQSNGSIDMQTKTPA